MGDNDLHLDVLKMSQASDKIDHECSSLQEKLNVLGYASIKCLLNHDVIQTLPYVTLLGLRGMTWHHNEQALEYKGDMQALVNHLSHNQSSSGIWNKQHPSNNVKASLGAYWVHLSTSPSSPTPKPIGLLIHHLKVHVGVKNHAKSSHIPTLIYRGVTTS